MYPRDGPRLRLLCFDGGGVRGLASLYVLRQCLSHVGNPKPCEYFDMISGTSTGGLIALMLGRLEMTIDECINEWVDVMQQVFGQRRTGRINPFNLKIRPQYDETILEAGIKRIIRNAGYPEETLLRGEKLWKSNCKTFVVALAQSASTSINFTDWNTRGESSRMLDDVTIWEAARATTAATRFFKPITILDGRIKTKFVDGNLGNNNPIHRLWEQASETFGAPLAPQVRCLLSIGTGKPRLQSFGGNALEITRSIQEIATDTEHKHMDFYTGHSDLVQRDVYWRFNPPDISDDVGAADFEKADVISSRTRAFGDNAMQKNEYLRFARVAGLQEEPLHELSGSPWGDRHNQIFELPATRSDDQVNEMPVSRPASNARLFYQLGPGTDHFSRGKKYWSHLTFQAYRIYERIYDACKDARGMVDYSVFIEQFRNDPSTRPSRDQVKSVWKRLLRDRAESVNSGRRFDKGFVLAVLYMLHVELVLPGEKPRGDDGRPGGVKAERRELLKRWPNWAQCECDCGLEWSFANDVGLHKPGTPRHRCRVDAWLASASTAAGSSKTSSLEDRALRDGTFERWTRMRH